jgi:hypothetical protein
MMVLIRSTSARFNQQASSLTEFSPDRWQLKEPKQIDTRLLSCCPAYKSSEVTQYLPVASYQCGGLVLQACIKPDLAVLDIQAKAEGGG